MPPPADSDPEGMDLDESVVESCYTQAELLPDPQDPNMDLTNIYAKQFDDLQRINQESEFSSDAIGKVTNVLQQSSILAQREKLVRESLFGGNVLSLCAQISQRQALALDTNLCSFDLQTFADGILNTATNNENGRRDWRLLEKRTSKMFKRAPTMSYMYGSFKPTELPRKEPKERAKRVVREAAEKKQPEKVTTVTATDEGNDKAVQHLKKVLDRIFRQNGNRPIGFFECMINPQSFHHTVENIFHLSFLLKNNHFWVKQNIDGMPYIHQVSPSELNMLQKGKKLQCIVAISPKQWKTLINTFNIKTPLIPPFA